MESQYSHSHVYVIVVFVGSKSQPIWYMLNWSRIVVVVEHVHNKYNTNQPSKEHKSQKSRTVCPLEIDSQLND